MKRLLGLILISVSSVVSIIVSIIGRYRIPFKIIKALISTLQEGDSLDCELVAILPISINVSITAPHEMLRHAVNDSNALANVVLILADVVKNIDASKVTSPLQIKPVF